MLIRVRDQIDCALLFDGGYTSFDGELILALLSRAVPSLNFRAMHSESGNFMVLKGEGPLFVIISQNREPLAIKGLRRAMSSPLRELTFPGLEEIAERHISNVFITVSHNSPFIHALAGMPGELADQARALGTVAAKQDFSPQEIESKIVVCQLLANFLANALKPSAVHWCQSDQLVTTDYFAANGKGEFPCPIHVHPFLFSSGAKHNGRKTIGFRTLGARHVIGREILFNECGADLAWMYQRAINLLQMARMNNYMIVPDGESFGADNDEVIRVRHLPAQSGEVPIIELTLEKSLEFGISQVMPTSSWTPPPSAPARPVFGKRNPN